MQALQLRFVHRLYVTPQNAIAEYRQALNLHPDDAEAQTDTGRDKSLPGCTVVERQATVLLSKSLDYFCLLGGCWCSVSSRCRSLRAVNRTGSSPRTTDGVTT